MNSAHAHGIQFKAHVKRLLKEFPFFNGLNTVVQDDLAGIVTHESRQMGDILWRQGDPPDDGCYVILSGEVQVWKANHVAEKAPGYESGSVPIQRHANVILNLLEDIQESPQGDTDDKTRRNRDDKRRAKKKPQDLGWDVSPEVHVKTLGVGVLFGEVALLEEKDRYGTFKCKSDCEFVHIKKYDFERLLKHSMNQIRSKQLSGPMRAFLREFDFFQKLEDHVKVRVPEIMQYQRFREGALVFKEGDVPNSVYIILSGSVNILKDGVNTTDDNQALQAKGWEQQGFAKRLKAAAMLSRLHEREDYTHQSNWVSREETADLNSLGGTVAKLGPSAIFGELALVENVPRSASVVCESDCEFLTVDADDFNLMLKDAVAETHTAIPELVEPLLKLVPFFFSLPASSAGERLLLHALLC